MVVKLKEPMVHACGRSFDQPNTYAVHAKHCDGTMPATSGRIAARGGDRRGDPPTVPTTVLRKSEVESLRDLDVQRARIGVHRAIRDLANTALAAMDENERLRFLDPEQQYERARTAEARTRVLTEALREVITIAGRLDAGANPSLTRTLDAARALLGGEPTQEDDSLTWKPGDPLPEQAIRKMRDGEPPAPTAPPAEGEHDWRFDGDDPYIVCAKCRERRDALSGRAVRVRPTPATEEGER